MLKQHSSRATRIANFVPTPSHVVGQIMKFSLEKCLVFYKNQNIIYDQTSSFLSFHSITKEKLDPNL